MIQKLSLWTLTRHMMTYTKSYLFIFVLAILLMGIDILFSVGSTWIQEIFIDTIDQGSLEKLLFFVRFGLAVGIGCLLMMVIQFILKNMSIAYISRDFSLDFFEECNKIPLLKANRFSSGDLVNRINKDAPAASDIIHYLIFNIVFHILTTAVVFIYLVRIDWLVALLALIGGPISFFIGKFFDKKIRAITVDVQRKDADVRNLLQEIVQELKVVKSLRVEKSMEDKYHLQREQQNKLFLKRALLTAGREQSSELSFHTIAYASAFLIAATAIRGELTPGEVLAFLFLTMRLMGPFLGISQMWGELQKSLGAGDRVFKIGHLLHRHEEKDTESQPMRQTPAASAQALQIANGIFSYQENKPLFQQLNLTIDAGSSVAVVGPSGSGKSTLAKLCSGLYELDSGSINIFGQSFDENSEKIKEKIAYVSQSSYLFSGTIRENIELGNKDQVTMEEVMEAAQLANAHQFIEGFHQQYETAIKERGSSLSGGQRQRIALARAFIRHAPLVILDEVTSALDQESERLVSKSIAELIESGTTVLFVTHNLSLAQQADRILVVDNGKIVEDGKHESLLDLKRLYNKLYHQN
ncbi:ABC transporter ATP-binding protein [Bacillus sp. SD088]|uniref:ABC transporter ATP-binding protein n=1 Tax=Bacillus sp. SD088 TaxID=2782012 RepID=UPI001A96EA38|nr:ABC transporter ATP-binding protein [Bacillus sp. SD088]MBO0994306.1 ABC transporter ATP-binding protein [Bacillus sp. SD088]